MPKEPKPQTNAPRGGNPSTSHEANPEQARETEETAQAENAKPSIRERMVNIGRANQQAGRQKKP